MSEREGPQVRIDASCSGCTHERNESYAVQGDSGFNVSCAHPNNPNRHIGDTTWRTPEWCPLLPISIEQLVRNLKTPPVESTQ